MATLVDLLLLKFKDDFDNRNIILQDDGEGVYLKKWAVEGVARPTKTVIQQWMNENDLALRQREAVNRRLYPPIAQQLEMMYDDKKNNTHTWVEMIDAIKAAHPKPTE